MSIRPARPLALLLASWGCATPDADPPVAPCDEPGAICTIAGVPERVGFNGSNMPANELWMHFPSALALSPTGQLHIVDYNNMRVLALDDDGVLRSVAGTGVHAYATIDTPAVDSHLENPVDVAFLPSGELLIVEQHAGRVLRIDEAGILRAFAGRCDDVACLGFWGDGGRATDALLSEANGVAVDSTGRVHIADTDNHCLRTVTPDGIIDRLAGDGEPGFSDEGLGRFGRPQRIVVDGDRLLVADAGSHAIRAIDLATGSVSTIVGTGVEGFSGDGGSALTAQLDSPFGVDVAPDGTLWIADWGNHRVRRVDPDGTIHTAAGTGEKAFAGDEGPASLAALGGPADVLVLPDGGVLIADMFNGIVRRIAP